MKKNFTIMIIPDGAKPPRQVRVPRWCIRLAVLCFVSAAGVVGYLTMDYLQLVGIRSTYQNLASENRGLKGEAKLLMRNLDDVKRSLNRVQDYSQKLGELTKIKTKNVTKKTGIGPVSKEELRIANQEATANEGYIPGGLNVDRLVFKPIFHELNAVNAMASGYARDLQRLLSTLTQQKSLLSSIPTDKPVRGWITSGYGKRVSPFTGEINWHRGIDIGARSGTPIAAPADGTVIFSGKKAGFGNFVMIAHGYGVVTRYGHNHSNLVQPGQQVKRGEQIATVGASGRATGAHLHYEILVDGNFVNPRKFILHSE